MCGVSFPYYVYLLVLTCMYNQLAVDNRSQGDYHSQPGGRSQKLTRSHPISFNSGTQCDFVLTLTERPTLEYKTDRRTPYKSVTIDSTRKDTLNCSVDGLPRPSLVWLKDGQPVKICHNKQVNVSNGSQFVN